MSKDSISNIITAFYDNNPDTIITGVYWLFNNRYAVNYKYNDDDIEYRATLRENTDEE